MNVLIVFAVTILTANALSAGEQWLAFKQHHNKSYKNVVEEKIRFAVFQSNLKRIEEHNARYETGEVSYYLGVNKFADMTPQEFQKMLLRQMSSKPKIVGSYADFSGAEVPDFVDWREKGAVFPVKDQGACGSCWAFSTIGCLEGQNFLVNNISIPLSVQELMDCSWLWGNMGCGGGFMLNAFEYLRTRGISSEESYPYLAEDSECRRDSSNTSVKPIQDYIRVEEEEDALKNAIATIGPISVGMFANQGLQLYEGGIFDDESCKNHALMNHGVLAIGYGSEDGKDFWLVKNSWGVEWGESGFFKLQRNPSLCGILEHASYPYF